MYFKVREVLDIELYWLVNFNMDVLTKCNEAKKDVFASGQGRLPSDVNLARSLQPVMDAAGSGRSGLDLDEGELERIRQRVLREAEENFKMEIRKLKGEGGTDSRSYHSASSGGDQGAPHAAQGDRAGLGSSTTPSRGDRVGLASMATPIHGGAAVNGTPGQGLQGVVSPPGLDQRGFLQGGVQGGHGESLKSYELPPLPDCPHKTALGGINGGDTKTPRRVSKIKEKMTPEKGSPGAAQGEKVAKVVAQDQIKGASTDGVAAEKEPVQVPVSVAPAQVQEAPKETAADLMKDHKPILRNRGPPGPRRLRGRDDERWHLDHLDPFELELVNSDSALMLKHMALWVKSNECRTLPMEPTVFFMESPEDPKDYLEDEEEAKICPSFNFKEVQQFVGKDQYYEEAVESEEETSDGSASLGTAALHLKGLTLPALPAASSWDLLS
ncbi:unnamed protein product [Cladocopium goreaui]|uniref:Uncharacterized protein n=1 Tax=Cladocopium goreaui TaxID=2562237 RepID=A0A9P1BJQ2_9DINO|nr:unnamed protein product [Cladocopium goreaui]